MSSDPITSPKSLNGSAVQASSPSTPSLRLAGTVTPEQEALLRTLTIPRTNRYIPRRPSPAQAAFLMVPHEEALYGGAAGGGKSVGLLMAALQYVDVPGYDAILFRRTFRDLALPEALMDLSHAWLDATDARWSGGDYRWHFPSGASLSFGYLATDLDKYRYQSAAFQFIGFDELTQFPEHSYRYLFSRLRRPEGSTIPLRMRAATNPGGVGHEWVRTRFIDGDTSPNRVFIPALLADNPYLDREAYVKSLYELDPVTRAQLLRGDWTARSQGPLFAGHWFDIVDYAPPAQETDWARYWDLAATVKEIGSDDPDWTCGVLMGYHDRTSQWVIADVRRVRNTPKEVERLMRQTADIDPPDCVVWAEREPGAAGKAYMDHIRSDVLPDVPFYEDRVSGDKVMRAAPLASMAEAGHVKLVRGNWNRALLDELEVFPIGAHDDQVDACSGAYRKLAQQQVTTSRSPF